MSEKNADEQGLGAEDARLIALDAGLKAHPASNTPPESSDTGNQADVSIKANQVLAELIGAPLGGGIIGWLLDRWFATSPWILLTLLCAGFIVAFRNIYRLAQPPSDQ